MYLLLDTTHVGQLCYPRNPKNQLFVTWLERLLENRRANVTVFLPEICDFELRRKLLHLIAKLQASQKSIERLDGLGRLLDYLPLDTPTVRHAASLWATSRAAGIPTASEKSLDGDAILAAQALSVGGTVVTANRKHLSRFVPAMDWTELSP
jgi:predicted nucleic acid-binding protein